ncbi:hypothetical protein P9E76_14490 [Schinkia azotoformans]|uniref:Uncharacterized protein n=1 Tax=Schinkia azotoformans LMG 9581 TaxID=1131731 RepID=K6D8H5_SCHAZ|nr:hypothetical protein [Schinkia azotoformans]EKN68842.1 hypothetical protein BAZO_02681 [Schinkia azotoformans LMG 9581]MEC1638316.1 hypothetical protein [Schinkia azotoformans]MEC1722859.1 hypothetical protein [Schinkia azotoformans]MEC1946250.1 hypothetical protein [Schinkia azotoformans]MED4414287.1 hypothetical protein [Schinkia azotoformans]
MHPAEIIKLTFVGIMITTIVIITLFFKGKWRKIGWLLALVTLTVYCAFYVVRPFWIDTQIDKKVKLIELYLFQRYPDEKWVISTVPYREEGFNHMNPYYINVVFESEPEVTYDYWAENKNNIYQIGYSTNDGLAELKHLEKKNE